MPTCSFVVNGLFKHNHVCHGNWSWTEWCKKDGRQENISSSLQLSTDARSGFSGVLEQQEEGQEGEGVQLPVYTVDFIASVTDNFDESNKLGEGGFGIVYKVIINYENKA